MRGKERNGKLLLDLHSPNSKLDSSDSFKASFSPTFLEMREWDYIIIGGGTAGLALASRLSENPNSTVLVLESGSSTSPASVDIPGLIGSEMGKDIDWKYSALSPCSAFSTMPWPRGKILVIMRTTLCHIF